MVLFLATMISCIFYSLELGIVIGMGLNLFVILYGAARPKITVEYKHVSSSPLLPQDFKPKPLSEYFDKILQLGNQRILLVTPTQSLLFPAAEYLRESVVKNLEDHLKSDSNLMERPLPIIIVINGQNLLYIDSTVAKVSFIIK